eukprot:7638445-Lingulodinium_polyedra.AAC.1
MGGWRLVRFGAFGAPFGAVHVCGPSRCVWLRMLVHVGRCGHDLPRMLGMLPMSCVKGQPVGLVMSIFLVS